MNTVVLNKSGRIEAGEKTVKSDPLRYLGARVALEEGYALRDFFGMLEAHPSLALLNEFLSPQLERYRNCPGKGCCWDEFEHLELEKTVELIGFPGTPRLEIYVSLHGIRDRETFEIRLLHLENLLDMPVRLGKLKHIVFGDRVDVFLFDTVFTLFEFIDGIAWELGFQSAPSQCTPRR
jgi:hypothetical protein